MNRNLVTFTLKKVLDGVENPEHLVHLHVMLI